MSLYTLYNIPAKNYFLSFTDLRWLYENDVVKDKAEALAFREECGIYYAENCNKRLSYLFKIEQEINLWRNKIYILQLCLRSAIYKPEQLKEIENVLKTFRVEATSETIEKDLEQKINNYTLKLQSLYKKLPEGQDQPDINQYYTALEFISSISGQTYNEQELTFTRFVFLIDHYGSGQTDKRTTQQASN